MKILILSGSRNREGQTARAINAICKGISSAKGKSEVIFLTELNWSAAASATPTAGESAVKKAAVSSRTILLR